MTVSSGAGDDATRVDRDPPSFPSVGDSAQSSSAAAAGAAPLFSAPGSAEVGNTPALSPVTTTPISSPKSRGTGGRLRWLVAGIATVLVLALVGGVLVLAAPRAGAPSATAHYVPADTGMYAEIRLDLPGDQHDNLAAFMSHFPGFADQAAFQQKLDESLNSVLNSRSNGQLDWNNDVKPWFGGQVAVFGTLNTAHMSQAMSGTSASSSMMTSASDSVIALTVTDKAKLQSVIDVHIGNSQVASTDYQGQQIKTIAQPGGTSMSVSYVVTDDALLVAPSIDLIKEALDVKAGQKPALADDSYYLQQLGTLHADRLATMYFNAGKQIAAMPMASNSLLSAQCTQMSGAAANVKFVGELRAESDHLAFTVRTQLPSGDNAPPAPTNKQTTLAQSMPSDTLFYLEVRNAGDSAGWLIKNMLTCVASSQNGTGPLPSALGGLGNLGDASQLFEQFLGAKPADYFDFVGDAAVGLTYTNAKMGGGIVATVDDQATATARVDKLLSLIQMLGAFGGDTGTSITTKDADHNGTKVTTITMAGDATTPPTTIQVATANGKLYIGMDDFVIAALDRSASDSLASDARYQKAIAGAPADNAGIVYGNIAELVSAAESNMPAAKKADFETNTKPFLDPLSSVSIISHVDGGTMISDGFLFVE